MPIKDREKNLQAKRDYYKANRQRYLDWDLERKFGITRQELDAMSEAQDHKCKLCDQPETSKVRGKVRRLAIDHCHETGKIRGLLCTKCNNALGAFKDNPSLLEKAAEYLRSHGRQS